MRTQSLTSRTWVGRTLVPLLLVWLSGVGCLLYCATLCQTSAPESCAPAPAVAAEHACCTDSGETAEAETPATLPNQRALRAETHSTTCCMLARRGSVEAPVPDGVHSPAATGVRRHDLPVAAAASAPAIPVRHAPPRSRGDTHLRCCVFLI